MREVRSAMRRLKDGKAMRRYKISSKAWKYGEVEKSG